MNSKKALQIVTEYNNWEEFARTRAENFLVGACTDDINGKDYFGEVEQNDYQVNITYERKYCGCCPGDIMIFSVPNEIFYVPADFLSEAIKAFRKEEERKAINFIEEQKIKQDEQLRKEADLQSQKEKELFLKLKEKYNDL